METWLKAGGAVFFLLIFPLRVWAAPIQGNIDDIAKVVLTYFPKVTGKVVAVEEERLRIDMGREKGLSEGVLLTVYREKEPFYHPVTGIELGKYEETVTTVEVTQIESDFLIGKRTGAPGAKVQVGDMARLSAAKIPVAIALTSEQDPSFLMTELASALSETGRFRVDPLPPRSTLEEALKRNDLYLIQVSTSRNEEKFVMNVQIKNTQSGRALSNMEAQIDQSQESDLILEHLQYRLFEERRNNKR